MTTTSTETPTTLAPTGQASNVDKYRERVEALLADIERAAYAKVHRALIAKRDGAMPMTRYRAGVAAAAETVAEMLRDVERG